MNSSQPDPALLPEKDRRRLIRAFGSESNEIRVAEEPLSSRLALYLITGLILSLIGIAAVFDLDRVVTSTEGEIITVQPTVVLQALDPSIIRSIDVEQGQFVKAGQLLETLDPTFTAATANALRDQIASWDATIARDEAELAGRPLVFQPSKDPIVLSYQANQQNYFNQRKMQFDAQISAYDEQIAQAHATIAKLDNDANRYTQSADYTRRMENMWIDLESKDSGSLLQELTAKNATVLVERSIEFDRNSITEVQHQIAATMAAKDAFIQQWKTQSSQELVTSRAARDPAVEQLAAADRHSELVRITAQDDSVVLTLPKVSVGSVVKQGDLVMELALLSSPVEAEIAIDAKDVGFVRPGDPVTVKLDAFHFVEHGVAQGKVRWISEGTFTTDLISSSPTSSTGQPVTPYYIARVTLTEVKLTDVPASFRLVPGMTLTADIHVGTRSLLMYLVRGIVRTVAEAMREPE